MIASKFLAKISPCITVLRPDVFSPKRGMLNPSSLRHPSQLDRLYFVSCGIGALPNTELCVAAYFWRCWAVQLGIRVIKRRVIKRRNSVCLSVCPTGFSFFLRFWIPPELVLVLNITGFSLLTFRSSDCGLS